MSLVKNYTTYNMLNTFYMQKLLFLKSQLSFLDEFLIY